MSYPINTEVRVIDTSFYSVGFPSENDDVIINRNNYITQIDDLFSQGIKLVFIDGEDDAGKTTLCAQYAKQNIKDTISVFFNPLNNIDYSIEYYCSNVVYQLKYFLNEDVNIEEQCIIGIEQYQQYVFHIRKFLKKINKPLTLIIDGLEERLKEKDDFIKELISLVPIGHETFNIIITGNEADFKNLNPKLKNVSTKPITLTGFAEPEIIQYLEIQPTSSAENRDIYKITKGYPGRLKTLKRLIKNEHYALDKITNTTTYKNWVELDCSTIDHTIPLNKAILSLFALTEKSYTIEEIAKICSISLEEAEVTVSSLKVLEKTNKYVAFVSTSHKKYYANLLRGNKKITQDLLINYYANGDTINSLIELPKLYAEKDDWGSVLKVIDDDYSRRIIQSTESIKNVNESLALGLLASEKMSKYTEMWRYSIESSIVNELDNYLFWESEVKARISIQDFAGAISLAESALLKVDRLKLLALIARRQKEIKNHVDEDLVNLINQLYKTADFSAIGDKIYDIVADLIYAIPNIAIEMIERSSGNTSEDNINDWIVAKLSIAAINSSIKEKEDLETSKKLEAVQSLNNPKVKKINKAITFLVGNYSASKVIEEVNKLSDSTERLRLLRLWLANNRGNVKDVEVVINFALDELISSSDNSITLDVLKELSQQLPFVKDVNVKDKLYYRFKSIENSLSDLGLSRNRYIYELNLFHTQYTIDKHQSFDSINRLLKEINGITDSLVQLEAYAEVYIKLCLLKDNSLQNKINFVYSRILTLSKELFSSTAGHLRLSEFILRTIGKRNPILGLKIIEEINLQFSREKAKTFVYESYLNNNLKKVSINILKQIEDSFDFPKSKEILYVDILERYAEAKSLHFQTIKDLHYYIDKIKHLKSPETRTFAYVQAYKIVSKNEEWKQRRTRFLESAILASWNEIEAEWVRIDIGFTVCADLSKLNPSFAQNMFKEAYSLKSNSWIDSSPVANAYLNSMRLVIRAFANLLIAESASKEDLQVLRDLMNRIPSEIEKLELWTELGFHCYSHNEEVFAKRIYNEHIIPLIEGVISKNIDLAPVLDSLTFVHLFNSDLVSKYVKGISKNLVEHVYRNICDYYVSKRNPFEVYDWNIKTFRSSFSDLTKAISALNHLTTDVFVYEHLELICNSIQESKNDITKPQNSNLILSLEEVVKSKLPDSKNIKHNGYKLLTELKLAKTKRESIDHNTFWKSFIDGAKNIPNKSDSVFVKAILLEDIPFEKISNGNLIKTQLYDEIISDLNSFVSHYEFVQRVIDISDIMYLINRVQWKKIVEKAFSVCSDLHEGSQRYKSQKQIVDSMYRIDPSYAKELIKLADKESEESNYGRLLHKHYEVLEISNKIKNNKALEDQEKEKHRTVVLGLLNTLKSINSEKTTPKKIIEASTYLQLGNKLTFHEAYPIYLYYLTNCVKTYKLKNLTGSVADLHKENFRKAVMSTNLIEILSNRKKSNEKPHRTFFIEENFNTNETINPGTRENALSFIKSWMIDEVDEYIIIADPYFKKEDLEILKIVKEVKPDIDIDILGSKNGYDSNLEIEFKDYWKTISDEHPPFTNITFCWIEDQGKQTPFHDRWIITKNGGLRMGTSLNSLGLNKESELSIMKPSEALKIQEHTLSEYIRRTKKSVNNIRVSYKAFSL